MGIGLKPFKILVIFSLFSLTLLVVLGSGESTSFSSEVNFSLSEKPILETPGYSIIQSNSLLPISSINSDETFLIETEGKETIIATVTGYLLVEWETDDDPCITASGLNVCEVDKNIVACPRRYPFGTKVLINEKVYTCEDRTNIKYDGVFDILFKTEKEMNSWGKRILPVTIFN
ncbi:MAG: hypothetical protein QME57_01765 [Patescibacteria group bacterium]|nr:hypothetical protein [Patescibacteria group bacterium]